jgi:hypothetical protein
MIDLVQEFFKRDLTEAEQEALSKLLERSPEAASSYERLLEQNYLATGLPQPTLPKGLQSLPHPGAGGIAGLGGSIKILLVVLAAAGVALWKFWPQTKAEISMPIQQSAQHILEKHLTVPVKPVVKKLVPIQPSAAGPAQEGQELSVIVDAPQRSLVTVRILGPAGNEVRALYTGFVEVGRWDFKWDGLLGNGEAAGPGDYRIDVQSGAAHQSKDIRIKLRQPAS